VGPSGGPGRTRRTVTGMALTPTQRDKLAARVAEVAEVPPPAPEVCGRVQALLVPGVPTSAAGADDTPAAEAT